MSRNTSSGRVPADKKEFLKAIARPLAFILCLIMVCAFLAHYLLDSETLSEYAENNPEAAYGDTGDGGQPDDTTAADTASESTDAEAADSAGNNDSRAADSAGAEQTADTGTEEGSTARTALTPDKPAAYNIAEDQSRAAADASSSAAQKEGSETMTENPERTVYRDGFYYEPLSDEIKERITGISYPKEGCTVPYEDLNYVGLLYVDFNGNVQEGELICNAAIAQDLTEIFYELYRNDYRLERVRLVDEYGGDDTRSMEDNNTSCFNYRVVDGTSTLSKHALGCAIDINPYYNPYVVYNRNGSGETYISPKGSEIYADRSRNFPYKIDENDLCYKLFTAHGFTWGGSWNSTKDYQHFQITLP